jgi:DNA-binding response OmpR family regulator
MAKNRLLLIEDDPDVAEMLLMYFEALSYEVLHADNGKEGIEFARTKFPNLILLDVMLPDMDGYEICLRMRKMSLIKYIPILFLTQKDERASKVKGLELGADDYITKPFDIDELRLRVEGAIRRASRENLHESRSGLPTGPLIQEERNRRKGSRFKELVFKLHGFSTYTDVYSFMAANDVIYHAAKTIREVLSERGQNDDFVGLDKDDFVVLTSVDDPKFLESAISQRFNTLVSTFYSFADSSRGGILLHAGQANEKFVPMMSLTTGKPLAVNAKASGGSMDW